jgi:hypothetical protein
MRVHANGHVLAYASSQTHAPAQIHTCTCTTHAHEKLWVEMFKTVEN